jgi:hypothetical protein
MSNNSETHYGRGTEAGHKGNSPEARQNSREAAEGVSSALGRRHRQCLGAWAIYGPSGATPEQVAADLELPVHVVRPRAGELVKRVLLYEVGKRPGLLGCNVMAYSTTKPSQGEAA